MRKHWFLDIATIAILGIAGALGVMSLWERVVAPVFDRRPVTVEDWEVPDPAVLSALLEEATGGAPFESQSDGQSSEEVEHRGAVESLTHSGSLPEWRLSPEPTLTLGQREAPPEELFQNVRGAVQMTDGRIAVVNGGSSEVIVFDAQGRHVFTAGGEGDGPAELRFPRLLPATRYDSLVLAGSSRVSVMTLDGSIRRVGSYGSRDLLRGVAFGRVIYHTFFSAGERVPRSQPRPDAVELGLLDASNGHRIPLSRYEYVTTYIRVVGEGRQRPYFMPLRRGLTVVPTTAGVIVVVGNERTLQRFGADGTLTDSVTLPLGFRPVTDDDIARAIQREVDRRRPDELPDLREILEQLPYPDHLPFVERMIPDETGGLWIKVFPGYPELEGSNWLALDGDAEAVGRVAVPDTLDLTHVGRDFVLGTVRDELGVQRVVRYRLRR